MDDALFFRLTRMKWHQRVHEIVTENTGRIDRMFPVLRFQIVDRFGVPFFDFLDRTTPKIVGDMQNMVAKVFEFCVGILSTKQVKLVISDEKITPFFRVVAANVL